MVEDELKKNPGATVDELYAKAKSAVSSIGKLTKRQFNARYPLQVKRRTSSSSGGGRKRAKKSKPRASRASGRKAVAPAGNREAVRDVFLRFASDLAAAEARKDLVKVLAAVDKYVDSAMEASAKA